MSELSSLEGLSERFWYWQGKSGTRYIHSIYSPDNCPPLPGAIFVLVHKRANGERLALEVGRFRQDRGFAGGLNDQDCQALSGADEVHVHLLARCDDNAEDIVKDLVDGVCPQIVERQKTANYPAFIRRVFSGFSEDCSPVLNSVPVPVEQSADISVQASDWQPGLFDDQGADRVLASA